MSLRFYLIRVSILALIRYNAPRSVSEPVGIRPILTALRTGLVYRSTPVMRYVVIRLCYHLLGRHTAYYRSCVPLGLTGRRYANRTHVYGFGDHRSTTELSTHIG